MTPWIGDLEVESIIKYSKLFLGYKNRSVWSSPEILRNKKHVSSTTTHDVYSFGIILWELMHNMVPFDEDLKLGTQFVV